LNEIKKETNNMTDSYSKKCIIFAIISIICSGIAGGISGFWLGLNIPGVLTSLGIVLPITAIIINLIGIMFGVISQVFKSLAKKNEPKNTKTKVGGIIGLVAMFSNLAVMVETIIAIVIYGG